MNLFKDFNYRLLRAFALTILVGGLFLIYVGMTATKGNTGFMIFGIVLIITSFVFARLSYNAYQNRQIHVNDNMTVYSKVCPKCGEMLQNHEKFCPHCSQPL